MKNLVGLVFLSMMMFSHADEKGNGGGALTCISESGRSTELVDLYEGIKGKYGELTIIRSEESFEVQLERALVKFQNLKPELGQKVRNELALMKSENKIVMLKGEKRLPPPSDMNLTELDAPRTCFIEGVANYNDRKDKLEINSLLIAEMSQTDIAALYFHEALYRVFRLNSHSARDSRKTRRITAEIFANEPIVKEPVQTEPEQQTISVCENPQGTTKFFINKTDEGVEMSFARFRDREFDERTISKIKINNEMYKSLSTGLIYSQRPVNDSDKESIGLSYVKVDGKRYYTSRNTKSWDYFSYYSKYGTNHIHSLNVFDGYRGTVGILGTKLKFKNAKTFHQNISVSIQRYWKATSTSKFKLDPYDDPENFLECNKI